jgi:aspartate/methionine/tyrosine aminotransferase
VRRRSHLSSRLPSSLAANPLSLALERLRNDGITIADLTESNPTRVGIPYPPSILAPLADADALRYEPQPFGLDSAREAVARDSRRRGVSADPRNVILTASTSESYSWLFKLLCAPGDTVLAPAPSYPLFEHLSRLEGIELAAYRLDYHGRWEIDVPSIHAAPASTRALILVSPNNPTGSYVTARELESVIEICRNRDWALIIDEVFVDYPLDIDDPLTDVASRADVLAFTLGGASKMLGLPQVKLGWIVAGGPGDRRGEALGALEHIADTFLSVSTPVQVAVPSLLRDGALVRAAIHDRVRHNLQCARTVARRYPSCEVLRTEGGWCATIRVPATRPEDILVLDLLAAEHVLVHPGYFFDFPHEAFIVVSLLREPAIFADAFERCLRFVS